MKLYAIIGETASGKSDLAIKIAQHSDAQQRKISIFSLDSLCVYRYIDIASAKPTARELSTCKHYGINLLNPNEACNAGIIMNAFQHCLEECKQQNNDILLLIGGSSFYLKSLIDGLSKPPPPLQETQQVELLEWLKRPKEAFSLIEKIDPLHASRLKETDSYRLQKALEIYLSTTLSPTEYYQKYPKITPLKQSPHIFNLIINPNELHQKIILRTQNMIRQGLIDEVKWLLEHYGSDIQPIKSIGIKESVQYLNQQLSLTELEEQIILHTKQFAKRQRTFNRTQFHTIHPCTPEEIYKAITELKHP